MSVAITLADDVDISRGDMIVKSNNSPSVLQDVSAMMCWLNDRPARPRAKYILRHTSNEQKAIIKEVLYKVNIDTFKRVEDDAALKMNDICKVKGNFHLPEVLSCLSDLSLIMIIFTC